MTKIEHRLTWVLIGPGKNMVLSQDFREALDRARGSLTLGAAMGMALAGMPGGFPTVLVKAL